MTLGGTAPVKPEYIISFNVIPAPDDDAAEGVANHTGTSARVDDRDLRGPGGPSRQKMSKEEKKANRGANKGRRFNKVRDEMELCWRIAAGKPCEYGAAECRFTHEIPEYLVAKPLDVALPPISALSISEPYVTPVPFVADTDYPSINLQTKCPVFEETGDCRFGMKCRFLGGHVAKAEDKSVSIVVDEEKKAFTAVSATEVNFVGPDILKQLRSRKYPRPISDAYLKEMGQQGEESTPKPKSIVYGEPEQTEDGADVEMKAAPLVVDAEKIIEERIGEPVTTENDSPDVPVRFSEKKRLDWSGKTYLAPLTTVGNLPFRRLCVSYGADITCGEMGLATSFLSGSKEEWSLVRRHPSEKTFGVQVAGNKPANLVPTAEVIAKEIGSNIDFVDVNCGCPIDLVFRAGSGSALLDSAGKLGKILIGMNKALGEIPVTVKLRTGVKDGRNTAHKLMPRLGAEWGASGLTLHGRSRQQRYTKLADWDYVKTCVDAVRAREADEDLPRIPIFGGGDCFSSEDYWRDVDESGVDGVMIARGALIKPWIFTEVKEHREWDISSRERLEGIRKYAEFGISHFGSDTAGVNTTRRFLCEALSFQYRYIPIGLLETLPGHIQDRAPAFRGRDDLETLLASDDSRDWVKISEMFLGPAPESWTFTPKHRSNVYGKEESQG